MEIDWAVVQAQLEDWGQYIQRGKKFHVHLSFNYVQADATIASNSGRKGDKRGLTSTTKRMLNELDLRVRAEEAASGGQVKWQQVYQLMRCPGFPCPPGQYCWIDPVGKKHYKLLTHHLKELVRHVEQGNTLETHDDVPLGLRQQLHAEEQRKKDWRSGKVLRSPGNPSSITINILPSNPQEKLAPDAQAHSVASVQVWDTTPAQDLEIEGPREVAVKQYSKWLQEQYQDPSYQAEVRKVEEAMLDEGFGLKQICDARNSDFLAGKKIKRGIVDSFMHDIPIWNKRQKAGDRAD